MTAASSTAAKLTGNQDTLRLVLFGMPAAGKSSLLGALGQAAQTQEHLLHGRLTDRSNGLTELQLRLYEEQPRRTAEEIVPYPITFEPFSMNGQPAGAGDKAEALVIDCDGRVANDLLIRRRALADDSAAGTLAHEVLLADTLILVVDASDTATQMDADFAEFGRFLHILERNRGERSEVGGLPVFLVLTKCDLLAVEGDKPADWMERIEERKRQVDRRFLDFLTRKTSESEKQPLPFGRIELHLWATAVKRPALAGTPAKPREPYGVAELFRQGLEYAGAFRKRHRHSSRRLLWTVVSAIALVTFMLGLSAILFLEQHGTKASPLLTKVENYRSREEQTASTRLAGPHDRLLKKMRELDDLRHDNEFTELPAAEQDYVQDRLQELQDYVTYFEKLRQARPIVEARSETDLKEQEQYLTTRLVVPAAYEKEWARTEAVEERNERVRDIGAVRIAADFVEDWYLRKKKEAEKLWAFSERRPEGDTVPLAWVPWHGEVEKLLTGSAQPFFREDERIPESRTVSYAAVLRLDRVRERRSQWDATRKRLERVRDISAALGLAGERPERPAPLRIPEPPRFSAAEAKGRLQQLQTAYPLFDKEFVLADLPESVRAELGRVARSNYEHLLDAGREVVLRQLQRTSADGEETRERWKALAQGWLAEPEELSVWRVLARVLARFQDPDAIDPVTALIAFLGKDRFDLDLKRLAVEIPDDLKLRPTGKLQLLLSANGTNGQAVPALSFELYGDGQRDPQRRVTLYTLWAKDSQVLTYRPGDTLWATLALKDSENREWTLTWVRCRSAIYQFERLVREPWLHRREEEYAKGKLSKEVVLQVKEGTAIPAVPDLMPVVILEKR